MPEKPRIGVNTSRATWDLVFDADSRARLAELGQLDDSSVPETPTTETIDENLRGASIVLSSWGALPLTKEILDQCPNLRLIVHAGGSIKPLVTSALLSRRVRICSASHVNAVPVARFVLGIILVSAKALHQNAHALRQVGPPEWEQRRDELLHEYRHPRVGIVGFGEVSRKLLHLLEPFPFEVGLSSNHITDSEAGHLRVVRRGVDELIEWSDILTLHAADIPKNRHLLNQKRLSRLASGSVLINTSRGSLLDEDALIERLRAGDLTAYLDVTESEPPAATSPLYRLENCILTPHIAGSMGEETHEMAKYAVNEIENWVKGRDLEHEIDTSTLVGIA